MSVASDPLLHEFAELVGDSGPVAVEGCRTRWRIGGDAAGSARLVSAPTGIVAHEPSEMTVRVRAGTSVAELHHELAASGQCTALPDRGGTVGGAVVVGENDLRLRRVGRLRDAVLQVRYVSAQGRMITGGGATVKNVSGYDLCRLITGSLGTLGLVAEVTLRTVPVAEECRWVVLDDSDPFAIAQGWQPYSAVLWDGERTWVCLEGAAADVADARTRLRATGRCADVGGPPDLPPCRNSIAPGRVRAIHSIACGQFVAAVGLGLVFTTHPLPRSPRSSSFERLSMRVKNEFDPEGRLNPGRRPGA
ncbi:glycolate oxidase FAD binding subunit [Ilumatobacter fluminis]|uniref:Glycolate oxidase FAD binding subunit n=1 Tax=Ilumatobacter fluminis TaxID=467091 RepID=A0A4R7HXI4_9ACTN|nr:FAD-binding protein [Ilumatobacter fluminis]TDT14926.1 glycolate oxidase FAD binding subunit [Ilumatobacter fluminis]